MHNDSGPPTSATLLGRLRQSAADQDAWGKFVDRYSPKIYAWCRRWGLQEADAEDVTQSVLVKLVEKMRVFVYDPAQSFRGWLRTLTHYAWYDFVQGRQRPGTGAGDSRVVEVLQAVEARDDLVGRLEAEFDRELLDEAMARVCLRVEPHTWDAFRLLAVDGVSGAEAAGRLHMKVATVFVARSKVQRMLQEEMRVLEGRGPEGIP
jgi:RNA polymerase sigma factor (sigma-70 family)